MKFFNFNKIKTQSIDNPIAARPLIREFIKESNSPNPETERGPRMVTAIPPPRIIRIHIKNKKPKS